MMGDDMTDWETYEGDAPEYETMADFVQYLSEVDPEMFVSMLDLSTEELMQRFSDRVYEYYQEYL